MSGLHFFLLLGKIIVDREMCRKRMDTRLTIVDFTQSLLPWGQRP